VVTDGADDRFDRADDDARLPVAAEARPTWRL